MTARDGIDHPEPLDRRGGAHVQWCSGKFGTVGTLGSPLPLLSPSFLFFSPPFPFSSLLSPTLLFPLLSGGNNFNDFPENQFTTDFALLRKPVWGNATLSHFPLVLIGHGRSLSGARGAKPPYEATYFQAFLDGGYCDNNMLNG